MLEVALGFSTGGDRKTDVGAAASAHRAVVAEGIAGQGWGYLGAEIVVKRCMLGLGASPADKVRFVGAASYLSSLQDLFERFDLQRVAAPLLTASDQGPSELASCFAELDAFLFAAHDAHFKVYASAIAIDLDADRVRGLHVGTGTAILFRRGQPPAPLVTPHYLHTLHAQGRLGLPQDVPLPTTWVARCFGSPNSKVSFDPFSVDLAPGDLLLITSRALTLSAEEISGLLTLHTDLHPLHTIAETLATCEREALAAASESHGKQSAFALIAHKR